MQIPGFRAVVASLRLNRDCPYWKRHREKSMDRSLMRHWLRMRKLRCNSGEVALHLEQRCQDHAFDRVPLYQMWHKGHRDTVPGVLGRGFTFSQCFRVDVRRRGVTAAAYVCPLPHVKCKACGAT